MKLGLWCKIGIVLSVISPSPDDIETVFNGFMKVFDLPRSREVSLPDEGVVAPSFPHVNHDLIAGVPFIRLDRFGRPRKIRHGDTVVAA
jgi:hypothetical protein